MSCLSRPPSTENRHKSDFLPRHRTDKRVLTGCCQSEKSRL